MSRYSPFHPNSSVTLNAADTWAARCLKDDGSLFSDAKLWTSPLLSEVDHLFNGQPDTGKDSFYVKLERQFKDASPDACKLLAEMLWILHLFPSNMGPAAKRRPIIKAWSWSGEPFVADPDNNLWSDAVLKGLGSAGPGFMNHKPKELRFLINAMLSFKSLEVSEQERLTGDPWAFATWLDAVNDEGYRQLRHILPHLLFPEEFERIASPGPIRQILGSLGNLDLKTLKGMTKIDQDRALRELRQDLEEKRGEPIDFYQPDIKSVWQPPQEESDDGRSLDSVVTSDPEQKEWSTPLNKILYGPPGTGKTYLVVERALSILDPDFVMQFVGDRDALKERFDALVDEGSIRFITFHQSFSYEEFVEGLRAETTADGQVRYHVEDGIFKAFCQSSATRVPFEVGERFSSGYVVTRSTEELLWLDKPNGSKLPIPWETLNELAAMVKRGQITVQDIRDGQALDRVPESRLEKYLVNGYKNVIPHIVEKLIDSKATSAPTPSGKRVLIIDEINRGNISKILGELITLLEPSKRLGAEEELTTILPYSKTRFGVPGEVHILGTMNTADRSLAAIDMALRRRFVFEEVEPQPEQLEDIEVAGVNIRAMFVIMNARIEALLDRDHRLGHAYFIDLEPADDIAQLKDLFSHRIIPLLKEYFFDDWQRIRLVLNDHRKSDSKDCFVVEAPYSVATLFGVGELGVSTNKAWRTNPEALDRPSAYQQIIG